MAINYFSSDLKNSSYLFIKNGFVIDIGYDFTQLTGYLKEDIFQKSISEIFENLLKINCTVYDLENNKIEKDIFLFTKSYEAIEINIWIKPISDTDEKLFIFEEKPNSRLDDKLIFVEQLFKDNRVGCSIYSVPDLILLKSNKKYLDFMDPPFNLIEKCIGTSLKKSIPGFEGSNLEKLFLNIIKTGKPDYYYEFKYEHYERGITYWEVS
jgi:hypothetical protein